METKEQCRLSLVAQLKNEPTRIKDWIEFHHNVGVDHFIIYLDNSEKIVYDILKTIPLNIEIFEADQSIQDNDAPWWMRHCKRQENSFLRAIKLLKLKADREHWAIFCDLDEYFVPQYDKDIKQIIIETTYNTNRIFVKSYDFKCPFDLECGVPVYKQSFMRWSDNTRINGSPSKNNIKGFFKHRGKSIVRVDNILKFTCFDQNLSLEDNPRINLHHINCDKPIYTNDIKVNHYRNNGLLEIYDEYDNKILNWI
jgi:hypothetical protein